MIRHFLVVFKKLYFHSYSSVNNTFKFDSKVFLWMIWLLSVSLTMLLLVALPLPNGAYFSWNCQNCSWGKKCADVYLKRVPIRIHYRKCTNCVCSQCTKFTMGPKLFKGYIFVFWGAHLVDRYLSILPVK